MATTAKNTKARNASADNNTTEAVTVANVAAEENSQETASDVVNGDTSTDATQDDAVKPVSAPPARLVDQRVLGISAMIMLEYPEGASIEDLSTVLGYDERTLTQLLNAMVHYEALVKVDGDTERWARGTAKPSTVDLGDLPACVHCGEYPSIMRSGNGSAPVKRTANGTGSAAPGKNRNGDRKLAPGELSTMVKDYIDTHPGQLTSSGIAQDLSATHNRHVGDSSVAYAIDAMLEKKTLSRDPRK